jgi:DNA-directed RNA polymerase specialized sigma24 family protein
VEIPFHTPIARITTPSQSFPPFGCPVRLTPETHVLMGVSLEVGQPERTGNNGRRAERIHRLHVAEFDVKRGVPVDPRFRSALARVEQAVFRYRSQELSDSAEVANIAEEAVYKANWTLYGMSCANPAAYVVTIFRMDADEFLKRHSRIISVDEGPSLYATTAGCTQTDVERRVFVRELLDSMDDVTRAILLRRVEGERPAEIGHLFGMSANAVSIRLSRALAQLRNRVVRPDE